MHSDAAAPETWVVDLDGVVWLSETPIPGSGDAVERLRAHGIRVLFATNNSAPTEAELIERLSDAGIAAQKNDVVSSAQAAASLLEPGTTAFAFADAGVVEALTQRGVKVVEEPPADTVVVGWTRRFDFDRLAMATTLVRGGARFIGTNEDATYPTPRGLLPGAGSLLAALSTAAQATPEVAGKPHQPMVELIRRRAGHVTLMVGDRPSTDGVLAQRLGVPFALVRTGVTSGGGEPMVVHPDEDAPDLRSLVMRRLG